MKPKHSDDNQKHRFRRVARLHRTYPPVNCEPGIPVTSIAGTSPIAQDHPEPPNGESIRTGLRNQSAYSDALAERLKTTAARIESGIADASPAIQASVESWCGLHGYVPSDDETDRAYWSEDSMNTDPTTPIVEYLRHGLTNHEDLPTRSSVHNNRELWYRVERGDTAPILVTPMTRSGARAILNETSARHLNNYHGVYPDAAISQLGQKALLAYLNWVFAKNRAVQHQRQLAGGLQKFEPGDIEDIPVIDPRELPDGVVATLAECFDELCETARRDGNGVAVIERIGLVLQRVL